MADSFSPREDFNVWNVESATGYNQLIVSVTNQTADTMIRHLTEGHGSLLGTTPRALYPYSTDVVGVEGDDTHGPDFVFWVDGTNGNSTKFEVQQDDCVAEVLGNTTGSWSGEIPDIDRIAVYNPSANQ